MPVHPPHTRRTSWCALRLRAPASSSPWPPPPRPSCSSCCRPTWAAPCCAPAAPLHTCWSSPVEARCSSSTAPGGGSWLVDTGLTVRPLPAALPSSPPCCFPLPNMPSPRLSRGNATPGNAAYGASKAALVQLGKTLAAELRDAPHVGVHLVRRGVFPCRLCADFSCLSCAAIALVPCLHSSGKAISVTHMPSCPPAPPLPTPRRSPRAWWPQTCCCATPTRRARVRERQSEAAASLRTHWLASSWAHLSCTQRASLPPLLQPLQPPAARFINILAEDASTVAAWLVPRLR